MPLPAGYRYFTAIPAELVPRLKAYKGWKGWAAVELTEGTVTGCKRLAGRHYESCRLAPEIRLKLNQWGDGRYIRAVDEEAQALITQFYPDAEIVRGVKHRFVRPYRAVFRLKIEQ